MQKNTKAKKKVKLSEIKLDYLTGSPVDNKTFRSAAGFLGSMLLMAFAFLLLGMALIMDNNFLRILFNSCVVLAALMLFFQNGAANGMTAVNQGEMMHDRQKTGHQVTDAERKTCYHPAKGFIIALLGCIPVVICAVLLAVMAKRQMTSIGALPSWMAAYENRAEIGNALSFYHQEAGFALIDGLRVGVRLLMMPIVNMVNAYGPDAMLTLERLSPVVLLVPALCYGLGYTQGVNARKQVHLGIAEGEAKRKKKEKRQRKAAQRQRRAQKGPEQLN